MHRHGSDLNQKQTSCLPLTWPRFKPIYLRNPMCRRLNATHKRTEPQSVKLKNFNWQTGPFIKHDNGKDKSDFGFTKNFSYLTLTLTGRFNTLRPRQNGCHFSDDIFKWIFLNENVWISINISLKFVPRGPINNIPIYSDQASSHYLNQWWLDYPRIYASLGLTELTHWDLVMTPYGITGMSHHLFR